MKWFAMIFSFFLGQLKSTSISPSLIFIQKVLEKGRGLVFLATVSFISSLLFAAGIVIAAVNGFAQYDQFNSVYLSATFVGGLSLTIVSTISLVVVFSKKNWRVPQIVSTDSKSRVSSPIEEAITLLINDFVSARKAEREGRAMDNSQTASSENIHSRENSPPSHSPHDLH